MFGKFLLTGQKLAKNLTPLFENVVIEPCLLHGDLWSGNITYDKNGEPVILDPACYCESYLVSLCLDSLAETARLTCLDTCMYAKSLAMISLN